MTTFCSAIVSGPFFRWPTNSGFDKFYGFIAGETNQWDPVIFDGVTKLEREDDPNCTDYLTDRTDRLPVHSISRRLTDPPITCRLAV